MTYLILWLAGAIFGAGGAWAAFARMKKDVNGLGRVVRRDRWNLMLALMVISEDRKHRQFLAETMRE